MSGGAKHLLRFALLMVLSACAGGGGVPSPSGSTPQRPDMALPSAPPSAFDALPGWRSEPILPGLHEFAAGCVRIADRAYAAACAAAQRTPLATEAAARDFLRSYFRPESRGADRLTGYFELTVSGSRTPDAEHRVPVLRTPPSPTQFARNDILAGSLSGRGLEVAYLRSEADLYFLQLQGSGRVVMTDGTNVRLGTAAQNGRRQASYTQLFDDLPIPGHDLSGPSVRAWAASHPAEFDRHLARDAYYVFFRETVTAPMAGPLGYFGRNLTPLLSVAVDPRANVLGGMLWINPSNPTTKRYLPHLVVSHDVGPAITGAARLDLFYGWGAEAEQAGGHQYNSSPVWALVPK